MKRKLIKQMLNEWKANIWLVVELVIVVLILQYTFSTLYSLYKLHDYSSGQKLENIYVGEVNWISQDNDDFMPYDSVHSYYTDFDVLMAKIRSNPYVEAAGAGTYNSLPYNFNFEGRQLVYKTSTGYSSPIYANTRVMSPELLELLQIRGINGETPKQLADMLRKGWVILSEIEEKADPQVIDPKDFLGKEVFNAGDTLVSAHVGAIAYGLRRSDYEPMYFSTVYIPLEKFPRSIVVKIKPGMGRQFEESMTSDATQAGNVFLTKFTSIDTMRDSANIREELAIRNFVICALFIMLVIFLGFLGTFWFRTQQRVSEIAIRKVNGATNRNIYARFMGEGMILLIVAVATVLLLNVGLFASETLTLGDLGLPIGSYEVLGVGLSISVISLVLIILAGIYAPARRATRVDPAIALKDM